MKIYISGKISGLEYEEAFNNFEYAEVHLEHSGHEPVNPMKKVSEQEGLTWEQYMCEDIAILFACDAIYLLPNWQDSKGARIEKHICEVLGKPVFYAASELPVGCDWPEPVEVKLWAETN